MPHKDLKDSVVYQLDHIRDGQLSSSSQENFLFFRKGNRIGAAVDTGDRYHNIHGIHATKAFTLDSCVNLLHATGNFLTMTVDISQIDLNDPANRNLCADIICNFVRNDDDNRIHLLEDPRAWAEKMIDALGNSEKIEKPHPYIAELFAVNKLIEAGLLRDAETEYQGPDGAVHDIEAAAFSLEVKSHLYADITDKANELVISSETQLRPTDGKPLYVVYFRMGKTGELSLKKMVDDFCSLGQPRNIALQKLENSGSGFFEGDLSWEKPYHLQGEPQVYKVTPDFPRITAELFPGGHWPTGISKLVYHVSLKNIPSCDFTDFVNAKRNGREPEFKANFTTGTENENGR